MYEPTPWLIRVWSAPTVETRMVMHGTIANFPSVKGAKVKTIGAAPDALPLRSDDTLAVFTYKLQRLLGAKVYWWVTDHAGHDRCPFVEGGGSGREPVDKGARIDTDALADLFETHSAANVVNVIRTCVLFQLNPHMRDLDELNLSVDPAAVQAAEKALCEKERARYTGKVTAYTIASPCSAVTEKDLKVLVKDLPAPRTMQGIRSLHKGIVRVSKDAIRRGKLSVTDAQSAAEELMRSAAPAFIVGTWNDQVACTTLASGSLIKISVNTELSDLTLAERAAEAAREEVRMLRKVRRVDKPEVCAMVSIRMSVLFPTLKFSKSELMESLRDAHSVLFSEPLEDGSAVVHLRRVPRFVATSQRTQFLESQSYMLDEGRFVELGRLLAKEFGLVPEAARRQVSEYAIKRRGKTGEIAYDVGAMAVLKVSNQGLHVTMQSEGAVAFASRILWLIAGLRLCRGAVACDSVGLHWTGAPVTRQVGCWTMGLQAAYRQCGAETQQKQNRSWDSVQFGEGSIHYDVPDWRRQPLEIRAPCKFGLPPCPFEALACGIEGPLPATLPKWAFGNTIRVGVSQEFDPVTTAVCRAMLMDRCDVMEKVLGMGVLQVARIARGNLLRRFIDPSRRVTDPDVSRCYDSFQRSAAGRTYAKQAAASDDVLGFALWNGYSNVMEYMVGRRARDHLFVVPILEAALRIGIVVLQCSLDGVSIHCPYAGVELPVHVVVLKRGDTYEPLVNVPDETLSRLSKLVARVKRSAPSPALSPNEELVKMLVDKERLQIEKQVINPLFQAVGVLVSGLYVPFMISQPCDLSVPMVFAEQIPPSSSERWTLKTVVSLFKRLEKTPHWYSDHEVLRHGDSIAVRVAGHFTPVTDSSLIVRLAHGNVLPIACGHSLAHDKIRDLMITHLISRCPASVADQRPSACTDLEGVVEAVRELLHDDCQTNIVVDACGVRDGTLLCTLRTLLEGDSIIADVWKGLADSSTAFTRVGVGPKSWRSAVSGLDLLTGDERCLDCLIEVVRDLGGPKLDRDTYLGIVARMYLLALDTGTNLARDWSVVQKALKGSMQALADAAYRCAERSKGPTPETAATVLGLCDVNVIAVDRDGRVVGRHADRSDRHVLCFEQPGGTLAFASVGGSRILTLRQLSTTLRTQFTSRSIDFSEKLPC